MSLNNPFGYCLKDHLMDLNQNSKLCVGIDISQDLLAFIKNLFNKKTANELNTNDDLYYFDIYIDAVLSACKEKCIKLIKWQSAYFEAYGAKGFFLLEKKINKANNMGFYSILDVKRSDIDSTMAAYFKASFEHFNCQAITLNPYMGEDSWINAKKYTNNKSIFFVWYTSNNSAKNFQDIPLSFKQISRHANFDINYLKDFNNLTLKDYLLLKIIDSCIKHDLINTIGLVLGANKIATLDKKTISKLNNMPLVLPGLGAQNAKLNSDEKFNKPYHIYPISRGLYQHNLLPKKNPNNNDPQEIIFLSYTLSIDYYQKILNNIK